MERELKLCLKFFNSCMSFSKSGGGGGRNWSADFKIIGVNRGRLIPIVKAPVHFFGSLFTGPLQTLAEPSFFTFSITCLATSSPSFQPASTSLGNCTPASTRDWEAACANCKIESFFSGKK